MGSFMKEFAATMDTTTDQIEQPEYLRGAIVIILNTNCLLYSLLPSKYSNDSGIFRLKIPQRNGFPLTVMHKQINYELGMSL